MNQFPIHLHRSAKTRIINVLLILVVLLMAAQPALARNANPRVFPPNAKPYGKSITEWSIEWWRYALGFPASTNPIADPTGADCAAGQTGNVFFLVGTLGADPVTRDECVVPVGKSILFPIVNVIVAVPDDGATAEEIISLGDWFMDLVDSVEVWIDGDELQHLEAYRFPSPLFSFDGATPGIFPGFYEGHRDIAFSDGWWIMLPPLPPGSHIIQFSALIEEFDFTIDVTYHLTVR